MANYAELEIRLYRKLDNAYPIEMSLSLPGSAAPSNPLYGPAPMLEIDPGLFQALILDPAAYSASLTHSFFQDPAVRTAFAAAQSSAQASQVPLRLKLRVALDAPELHRIAWELLLDPQDGFPLATGENVLFSRFLSSPKMSPVSLPAKSELRALVIIANPSNLPDYQLAPIDVPTERARARAAFGEDIQALPDETGKLATLDNLLDGLRAGATDILYLVCHGAFIDPPRLWLENEAGKVKSVSAVDLVEGLKGMRTLPLLALLASCESAGDRTGETLRALGPLLVEAGIPAVVAMQGKISMQTAAQWLPVFVTELLEDGQLDRAMAVARRKVRNRPDGWMPVLFTRLTAGCIFAERKSGAYSPPKMPAMDELPEPGPLPPGSHLPLLRNHAFTGRVPDLRAIAEVLFYPTPGAARRVALTGGGGSGKSQLAVEFCYRYGRFTCGIHWLDATQSMQGQIAACGAEMKLSGWENLKQDEQVQRILESWSVQPERLVVLDNLDVPPQLTDWLDVLKEHPLLVTSRRDDYEAETGVNIQPVLTLPRTDGRELLRKLAKRLEDVSDDVLDTLCDRLGDLPLALDLAGRYLAKEGIDIPDYLDELKEVETILEHESFISEELNKTTAHVRSLAATFRYSWKDLQAEQEYDLLARRLFLACGYCAANIPIPPDLLLAVLGLGGKVGERKLKRSLNRLYRLGLLAESKRGALVHPLLAEFARQQDKEVRESALPGLADVLGALAGEANRSDLPERFKPLRPHVESAAGWVEKVGPEQAGLLWNEFGHHLHQVAEYAGAGAAYERALRIDEAAFGPDHPEVATDVNNLGLVLRDLGDLAGARAAFERALAIWEKALGPNHPQVATGSNNLGGVLQDLGDLAGARAAYERALRIDEAAFGPDHPNVALRVWWIGTLQESEGDDGAALLSYRRALAIFQKNLPAQHKNIQQLTQFIQYVERKIREEGDPGLSG